MAKTLNAKKRKVAPKKVAKGEKGIVLVGTYKAGRLERWPGWYNYPISAKDKIDEKAAKRVTELWLFRGCEPWVQIHTGFQEAFILRRCA